MPRSTSADAVTLTEQLVNIESVSRNEAGDRRRGRGALRPLAHLEVTRHGNTVVAGPTSAAVSGS